MSARGRHIHLVINQCIFLYSLVQLLGEAKQNNETLMNCSSKGGGDDGDVWRSLGWSVCVTWRWCVCVCVCDLFPTSCIDAVPGAWHGQEVMLSWKTQQEVRWQRVTSEIIYFP